MSRVLEALAALSKYIPSVEKPARRPPLPVRLAWTAVIVCMYLIMSEIPLYGVVVQGRVSPTLFSILLGANVGTLMTLGIGPIVTAGIVLEVLVGGGLIQLDLTKPRDRAIFMGAQRTLALLLAAFEASMYALGCRFWVTALGGGGCPATLLQRVLAVVQLTFATLVLMWFDELTHKGWGIGSALSLFIVASVMKGMAWDIAGIVDVRGRVWGVIPALIREGPAALLRPGLYPDLIGFIATIAIISILIYLQTMRVDIPITSPRYAGIRSRIPLNFIYVTNIPILFVAIFVADLRLFASILASFLGADNPLAVAFAQTVHYMTPPRGLLAVAAEPVRAVTSLIAWLLLALLFGFIWVEVAGLNPERQAENLVKSGLEIPGVRRNPKILEQLLARYIYPLTVISSLIVGLIAVVADYFKAYGTGSGLILSVGIIYNFYQILAYERTLEMYPLLRKIVEGA